MQVVGEAPIYVAYGNTFISSPQFFEVFELCNEVWAAENDRDRAANEA